ncbi:MAG: hypothetical protein QOD72_2425 [Acidimicrobiaceae bacterium]|jgi:hypothetical protein|nr:hypothetical protein [Acidimicrobiaceae bacterium]
MSRLALGRRRRVGARRRDGGAGAVLGERPPLYRAGWRCSVRGAEAAVTPRPTARRDPIRPEGRRRRCVDAGIRVGSRLAGDAAHEAGEPHGSLPTDAGLVEGVEPVRHVAGGAAHVHSPTELLEVDDDGDTDIVGARSVVTLKGTRRCRRGRPHHAARDKHQRDCPFHMKDPTASATSWMSEPAT